MHAAGSMQESQSVTILWEDTVLVQCRSLEAWLESAHCNQMLQCRFYPRQASTLWCYYCLSRLQESWERACTREKPQKALETRSSRVTGGVGEGTEPYTLSSHRGTIIAALNSDHSYLIVGVRSKHQFAAQVWRLQSVLGVENLWQGHIPKLSRHRL